MRRRIYFSTEASLFTVAVLIAAPALVALSFSVGFSFWQLIPGLLIYAILLGTRLQIGADKIVVWNAWDSSELSPAEIVSFAMKQTEGVKVLTLTQRSGDEIQVIAVRRGALPFHRWEQRRADRALQRLRSVVPAAAPVDGSDH